MAAGTYKNGVAIIYTYQAVGVGTGKTITSVVYDEGQADSTLGGILAEIGTTGRYWKAFTPDAEGEWIVIMTNTTDGGGDVVKAYAVAGHDVDSMGDAIATIDSAIATIDTEVGNNTSALTTIDTEVGNNTTAIGVVDGLHDVPGEDGAPDATIRDVVGKKTDTVGGTSIVALAKQVLADTGSTGSIRGADDDTLKSLSDQIDSVSSPAMVG